jgi:hypothetical protein
VFGELQGKIGDASNSVSNLLRGSRGERRGQLDHASHSKTLDAVPYWALQKRHNGPKWCAARAVW